MGLVTWLVIDGLANWAAGIVMKGGGFGLIGSIVVGIIGAQLGGWLAGTLFNIQNPISGFNLSTLIVAFLGAVLLLYIVKLLKISC